MRKILILTLIVLINSRLKAENESIYNSNINKYKDYTVKDIIIKGNSYMDEKFIKEASGLAPFTVINISKGDLTKVIKNIISHNIVQYTEIYITENEDDKIIVTIEVKEFPRYEGIKIIGISEKLKKDIIEKLSIEHLSVLSPNYIEEIKKTTIKFLKKENILVKEINHKFTTENNSSVLEILINGGGKKKIGKVLIEGVEKNEVDEIKSKIKTNKDKPRFNILQNIVKIFFSKKILKTLTSPIEPRNIMDFFKRNVAFIFSELNEEKILEDKKEILNFLKSKGYLNAEVDFKIYENKNNNYVNLLFSINKKQKYTLGKMDIVGNTAFSTKTLKKILKLKSGDPYNKKLILERLNNMMIENSVAAVYYGFGYLRYHASLSEKKIDNNVIDIEIEIIENDIYRIGKISTEKNSITKDNIILRETVVLPGENFNGEKLVRSIRELAMLGILDPAKLNPKTIIDEKNKKLDIVYIVGESPKVGFGFNLKLDEEVGIAYSLDLSTNNAALGNIFKKAIPLGSNQSISLSTMFSKSGQKHAFTFMDPMISEKYPHNIYLGASYSKNKVYDYLDETDKEELDLHTYKNDKEIEDIIKKRKKLGMKEVLSINGGWGKKFQFIDYSTIKLNLIYKHIKFDGKYSIFEKKIYKKGNLDLLALQISLSRDTRDAHIFPKNGYLFDIMSVATPPYSLIDKNQKLKKNQDIDKIKCIEYYQTIIDFSFYKKIFGRVIANVKLHAGLLGSYNGVPGPFDRFSMGGTDSYKSRGIINLEHITLRGYNDDFLTPKDKIYNYVGGVVFEKAVFELKYPIIESAIIHLSTHSFIEAGNCWAEYKKINILNLKGSFGFGFRAYIGLVLNTTIGIDFGCPINQMKNKNRSFLKQISVGISR